MYDRLAANVDTTVFVLKTKYQTDKTELTDKIPDVSSLARKTALNAVENKIPDLSSLVKKTDYNTRISELEKKLNNKDRSWCQTVKS